VLLMRGPEGRREVATTREFLRRLGARVHRLDELDLPEGEGHRVLVVLEKVSATPAKFPRQGSQLGRFAP
jgi:16S rRNA G527 N7-methylase RsmG